MAKKKKQMLLLLIALGVAVLLLVGLVIWNWYRSKQQAAAETAATIRVTTVTDPVQLTYCNGKQTLSFTKKDDSWTEKDHTSFPLDSTYLDTITTALSGLTADRKLDIVDQLSAYGLKDAKQWVTVTNADGDTATLYLGNATGESDYYAMLKGGDTIYTIPGDLVTDISYDLYGLAKLDDFPALSSSNTKTVAISGKMNSTLTVKQTASTAESEETASGDGSTSADASQEDNYNWYLSGDVDVTKDAYLTALRTEIDAIAFTKLADYQPSKKELKGYGLTDPTAGLTVKYADSDEKEQTVTLLIGNTHTDADGTAYYYAMLKGNTDKVYLIKADGIQQTAAAAKKGYAKAAADYKAAQSKTTTTE